MKKEEILNIFYISAKYVVAVSQFLFMIVLYNVQVDNNVQVEFIF